MYSEYMHIYVSCRGAKDLVTPLLAGLLETDPKRVWGFDQFFAAVKGILCKQAIHVFDLCHCDSLHIYIDGHERLVDYHLSVKHTFFM